MSIYAFCKIFSKNQNFRNQIKDPGERRAALAKSKHAETLAQLKADKQRKEDAKRASERKSLKVADVFSSEEDSDDDERVTRSDSSDIDSDDGTFFYEKIWPEIKILFENRNFIKKRNYQNSKFWSKKSLNVSQKSKFRSKIKILVKTRNLVKID